MSDKENAGFNFLLTTGFGARTQEPFVNLTEGGSDFHVQMSPEEAVDLAHNLLACAEAAVQDAMFIRFMREVVGLDDAHVFGMLMQFRQYREERQEKK